MHEYSMRINKYLAEKKLCSRREADELIKKGKVYVNGRVAVLGEKVSEKDRVELKRGFKRSLEYFAYYKPRGLITHAQKKGEQDIAKEVNRDDITAIGRLDKDSEGLILLTDDGRLTKGLLSPEAHIEKEYEVVVDKELKKGDIGRLEKGVDIEGYITKECRAKKLGATKLSLTITEGKKHQVRRMLAALGYTVLRLKRVRIAHIMLGAQRPNELRTITNEEKARLLSYAGLTV